jgi:hypothetical protein
MLARAASCSSYTMTWTIPMECHIKMPFSGVTKILLMETQTNTIFLYYVVISLIVFLKYFLLTADSPTAPTVTV